MSATHVIFFPAGAKSRLTMLSAIGSLWLESVVDTRNFFTVEARIPACFISLATVFRLQGQPVAMSSWWTRGAPYE